MPWVGLQADFAQVRSAPVKVSSKEADDNLQVKTLQPEYPPEAKAKGIEGTVHLRIVIDDRGNVTDVKALSGNPLLVPPAIALVKRFPYRPFVRGGKRVLVTTEVDVPFELNPRTQREIDTSWMFHRKAATDLEYEEKIDAAIGELQEALEEAQKLSDADVADTYNDMANLYSRQGRYSDAEAALKHRLDILQHSQTQDELEIANTQSNLAAAYLRHNEVTGVQELLQKAIPVQEEYIHHATLQETKDTYAGQLALSLGLLALLHDRQGQFAIAEPLYKRSVSLGQHGLHVDDEARIMRTYAEMLIKMGRADDAAKLREEATILQLGLGKQDQQP